MGSASPTRHRPASSQKTRSEAHGRVSATPRTAAAATHASATTEAVNPMYRRGTPGGATTDEAAVIATEGMLARRNRSAVLAAVVADLDGGLALRRLRRAPTGDRRAGSRAGQQADADGEGQQLAGGPSERQ